MSHDEPSAPGFRAIIRARVRDWTQRVPLHVFGGRPLLDAELPRSRVTGRPFHVTFDLDVADPRLSACGVTTVKRLAILASFQLDRARGALTVRHLDGGRTLEVLKEPSGVGVHELPDELPQLPVDLVPLSMAEVAVESAEEMPDDHVPLHQVGGRPVWRARPLSAPLCPVTGAPMRFLAAVDSILRFPLGDSETQLLFGDCGTSYVFWSDAASVSTSLVQVSPKG